MAIVAEIFIESGHQHDHDRLQSAIESRIREIGRPPDGLMVHVSYPRNDGFVIVEAWRTEELFRSYMDELLGPAVADVALAAGEPEIGRAWSIARPSSRLRRRP